MDSEQTSGHRISLSITSALVSAVLEWVLMFMIFIDASFAYLVTSFARHYHLQIPCLLCSRLDHVLGNERAGFYWDLICHKHKSKISSLALCQLHNNVQGISKYDRDELQEIKGESSQLGQIQKKDTDPLPHVEYSQIKVSSDTRYDGDEWQEINGESSRSGQIQKKDTDPLPHVEYSQIKVSSDTESEGPFSDNESGVGHIRDIEVSGQDPAAKYDSAEPQITTSVDWPPTEKLIHLASPVKVLLSETDDLTYSHQNVESKAPIWHGLEELNWQQDHNDSVSNPSEVASFPDDHPSPNANATPCVESDMIYSTNTTELEKEVPVEYGEASKLESDSTGAAELCKEVNIEYRETSKVTSDAILANEIHMDLKPNKNDTSSPRTESFDLGDAYKLAVGVRGRQLSGRLLEQQRSMTDSTKASEDLKLLLSQISAVSPKLANNEDFKAMDSSAALGQIFQRRVSLERNESNLSLDGSTVSEIEGESEVDRLKRQVENDKKMLSNLYKDLEEERNASAIAANQAMAMITRLQEEKAAFHMEALQCLRMMEEQAEYDGEALQKANELLSEREKQIQDFEYELELYRNQFGDLPSPNDFFKPRPESESDELKEQILEADCTSVSLSQFEDERRYILRCLKELEEKLSIFTKNGAYSEDEVIDVSSSDQDFMGLSHENGGMEKSHLPRDTLMLKETGENLCGDENSHHENRAYSKLRYKDVEIDALSHELSVMKNRLGALEAEQNIIECSINALEKGSQGFEFIREIAVRLQELHSAHLIKRNEDLI